MEKATVINIQKYSIHDGPGIRTTVFFKGCPLSCWWCHNPESHKKEHELMFYEDKCKGCGKCSKRCPQGAITLEHGLAKRDASLCSLCGRCAEFCVQQAFELVGQDLDVNELMKEILKDKAFYENSNGGVSFSGGEPMLYADYLKEVLTKCKMHGIHVAMETSGCVAWSEYEKVVDGVDLFLYDIKHIDDELHKKYMGASNQTILANLQKLSDLGKEIIIRMPIIAGVNDDLETIDKIIAYLKTIRFKQVDLLPYHKLGMNKYHNLARVYLLTGMEKPSDEVMQEIKKRFESAGMLSKIGG